MIGLALIKTPGTAGRISVLISAGPSSSSQQRAVIRYIHSCVRRNAKGSTKSKPFFPLDPFPRQPPPPRPTPVPLTSPWPWRPLSSPESSRTGRKTNTATQTAVGVGGAEERVIYARSLPASPRRNLFLACSMAWFGILFYLMPDKPRMPDWWSVEDVGYATRVWGTINNHLLIEAPPYLAVIGGGVALYRVFLTTRRVTRLSLIRIPHSASSPTGGEGKEEIYLRMMTGRQALLGRLAKPRDFQLGDLTVAAVPGRSGKGFLSLVVADGARRSWTEERPYYMDFRDTRFLNETQEEVVVSLNRLENVFGKVDLNVELGKKKR
ncbi:hypothetical protein IAR55_000509 [Kwoniella newhampshirensis]|uniref:Mitochondrial protein n=1 Tax=Kwoniella newhampshirensis TaxID=1651941 RepID=A0AAW0Z8F4_9TREE